MPSLMSQRVLTLMFKHESSGFVLGGHNGLIFIFFDHFSGSSLSGWAHVLSLRKHKKAKQIVYLAGSSRSTSNLLRSHVSCWPT